MTIQGTLGQQILFNQTVILSGSFVYEVDQNQQILLYWNITGPVTGTLPTIQFTMQGLDPTDTVTPIAQISSSSIITNTGTGQLNLAAATSPFMLISWTVGGTTPSFGGANLAVISRPVGSILISNQGTPNTLANAWTIELTDGINGPVAVKAPSTAAAATDPALVVAISPNNVVTTSNLSVGATGAAPPADATYIGGSVTTTLPTYTTGQMDPLSLTTTGLLRIDGSNVTQPVSGTVTANAGTGTFTVSGTVTANAGTGNFTVVQATAANLNATVVASGNFNNASVGATAAAPPASATYVGGSVTTAAPAYTTGQLDPLSLTTAGLLRIDGVYPINATTPTSDVTFVGGAVTTAAPGYTTGQLSALSLTTAGALRIDGSAVTQPVSGTVAVTQSTSPWVVSGTVTANAGTGNFNNASIGATAAAPPADATYMGALATTAAESGLTNNDMYPLNLTTTGQLRIDGVYPLATAVATAVDMHHTGGVVTTAAPAYTTATINALSLTTVGGLRIDSAYPTGTATASAPDATEVGGIVTTAAPTYTTGQLNALSLDTAGNLRVASVPISDFSPATQNITAQDIATTTTVGDNGQLIYTGTPTAGSAVSFVLTSRETVQTQVTGIWTGSLQLEVSIDGGTTWYAQNAHQAGIGLVTSSFNQNFGGGVNVGGHTNFRVRSLTAWTGTATVAVSESINNNVIYVGNPVTLSDTNGNSLQFDLVHQIKVEEPYRLVGATFGTTAIGIDSNFWTTSVVGTGASASVTTNGIATLVSGTSNPGYGQITTVNTARYVPECPFLSRSIIRIPTVVVAGSTRNWGAYTISGSSPVDGFYFSLSATGVLSVNTLNSNSGTPVTVSSGSFNGIVSAYTVNTNQHTYEIVGTPSTVQFFIDGVLIHTFIPTTLMTSSTYNLPCTKTCLGTGTSATMEVWSGAIFRLGRDLTAPVWKHIAGANAGTILKSSPGVLRSITIGSSSSTTTVSLYDATSATNAITIVNEPAGSTPTNINFNVEFHTGLYVVTAGTNTDVTIIYE